MYDFNYCFGDQKATSSTPLKQSACSSSKIRLSDIDVSTRTDVNDTKSSGAPSLPSGLLEMVGDSWLNESVSVESSAHGTSLNNQNDSLSDLERGSNLSEKYLNASNVIQAAFEDRINTNINLSVINSDHSYSTAINTSRDEPPEKRTDTNVDNINNLADTDKINADVETRSMITDTVNLSTDNDAESIITDTEKLSTDGNTDTLSTASLSDTDTELDKPKIKNLKIQSSKKKTVAPKEREVISKQYFCPFCKILVTKFARHLENRHKNTSEVKKLMSYPIKSKKRVQAISEIRNRGTHLHNQSQKYNTGTLITSRRSQPGYNRTVQHFQFCNYCNAYLAKTSLRKHEKTCPKSPKIILKNKNIIRYKKFNTENEKF